MVWIKKSMPRLMMSPASMRTPVGAVGPFDAEFFEAGFVQFVREMGGHGGDLAVGEAGGDDHAVGEARPQTNIGAEAAETIIKICRRMQSRLIIIHDDAFAKIGVK
jgi:hypothetical protein